MREEDDARAAKRYRVFLRVTHGGHEGVDVAHAEDVSKGGLFVRGEFPWQRRQRVALEVELPGSGEFSFKAKVAHVLTTEGAERHGRSAGVGLSITKRPRGFDRALGAYLKRLERRSDFVVLVCDEECCGLFHEAGYQALPAPHPSELEEEIACCDVPVIAVIVPQVHRAVYESAAEACGAEGLVYVIDFLHEFDQLLVCIDEKLSQR